jgi:hypothetical protein
MPLPPLPPIPPHPPADVSLAQNGFWKIPNGLWLQWGRATLFGGGGSATVTFPKAFPNQCYNVQATVIASPNTSLAYTVQVEAVTKAKPNQRQPYRRHRGHRAANGRVLASARPLAKQQVRRLSNDRI